jgi:hypothetical protein
LSGNCESFRGNVVGLGHSPVGNCSVALVVLGLTVSPIINGAVVCNRVHLVLEAPENNVVIVGFAPGSAGSRREGDIVVFH